MMSLRSSKYLILASLMSIGVENAYSPSAIAFPQPLIAQQTTFSGQDFSSFFETGRLRSQDQLIFQKPQGDVIPVREQSNSWQFIIFREGNVSFWMPPGVLINEEVVLDTKIGPLSFRTLASEAEDRRYMVAYASGLTPQQVNNSTVLLDAIREKAIPSDQFELKQDRKITLENYPGRELSFENQEEMILFRAYLVDNKIYALGVRYPKSAPQTRQTRAFLNALQLLE